MSSSPLTPSRLGSLRTGPIGFGCMGLSEFYGPSADEQAAQDVLDHALDLGVTLFDTADMYGKGHNEQLVGRFLARHSADRQAGRLQLATKCGIVRTGAAPSNGERYDRGVNNDPAYIRAACDASLQRLGTDHIDLYYIHRVDHAADITVTMETLAQLHQEGKIGAVGLCEVSAETLRRAHATFPVTAVQSEYSLWSRDVEAEVLPTCRELGVGLVAYSPLGRGFLTGTIRSTAALDNDDFRRIGPRFQGTAFDHNLALLSVVEEIAAHHQAHPGQVALAWLLAQGPDVVPIPGTKRRVYLDQNMAAATLTLSETEVARLNDAFAPGKVAGDRYPKAGMALLNA